MPAGRGGGGHDGRDDRRVVPARPGDEDGGRLGDRRPAADHVVDDHQQPAPPGHRTAQHEGAGQVGPARPCVQPGGVPHPPAAAQQPCRGHRDPGPAQLAQGGSGQLGDVVPTAFAHRGPAAGQGYQHHRTVLARRRADHPHGQGEGGTQGPGQLGAPVLLERVDHRPDRARVGRGRHRGREAVGVPARRGQPGPGQQGGAARAQQMARVPAAGADPRQDQVDEGFEHPEQHPPSLHRWRPGQEPPGRPVHRHRRCGRRRPAGAQRG